jgi:hypothetical protein
MAAIDPNAFYHKEINMNQIVRFPIAMETTNCESCCFYIQEINDHIDYPVFNGTHLINGTDVYEAYSLGIGLMILNGTVTVLPCPELFYTKKLMYYMPSSGNVKRTHVMLIILVIVSTIFLS